jgi:hypothetical protein
MHGFLYNTPKMLWLNMQVLRRLRAKTNNLNFSLQHTTISYRMYRGADKSLAQPERKQSTATGDFDVHISYLLS